MHTHTHTRRHTHTHRHTHMQTHTPLHTHPCRHTHTHTHTPHVGVCTHTLPGCCHPASVTWETHRVLTPLSQWQNTNKTQNRSRQCRQPSQSPHPFHSTPGSPLCMFYTRVRSTDPHTLDFSAGSSSRSYLGHGFTFCKLKTRPAPFPGLVLRPQAARRIKSTRHKVSA